MDLLKMNVSNANGKIKSQKSGKHLMPIKEKAATGEATAAESGATALRTKAGAADIEGKALKIT